MGLLGKLINYDPDSILRGRKGKPIT